MQIMLAWKLYAKYAEICTPHFADVRLPAASQPSLIRIRLNLNFVLRQPRNSSSLDQLGFPVQHDGVYHGCCQSSSILPSQSFPTSNSSHWGWLLSSGIAPNCRQPRTQARHAPGTGRSESITLAPSLILIVLRFIWHLGIHLSESSSYILLLQWPS